MRTYNVTVTMTVTAADEATASDLASAAAEHLLETFNDDGSIESAGSGTVVEWRHPGPGPFTTRDEFILAADGTDVWGAADAYLARTIAERWNEMPAPAPAPRRLDDRQTATILAALRLWQRDTKEIARHYHPIATDGGVVPLDNAEIDALCEQLNF